MEAIHAAGGDRFTVIIVHVGNVSVIDSTGLVALDNAIGNLIRRKKLVVLAGPLPRPQRIFDKARLAEKHHGLHVTDSLDAAIGVARELAVAPPPVSSARPSLRADQRSDSGASINGRLLAQTAVTLDAATVTKP